MVADLQLTGNVALLTGSTTGIGFAIGSSLAGEGATVIINGRSERHVGDAIATIRQKHPQAKLEACAGDLSTADTARGRRNRALDHLIKPALHSSVETASYWKSSSSQRLNLNF